MARPIKTTVDWFPVDCTMNGKTMFTLETKYGNNGFTFWVKLLQSLGSTPGHALNLSYPAEMEYMSAKVRLPVETTIAILDLLSTLKAIDSELWKRKKTVWCQNFIDRITPIYEKRGAVVPTKPQCFRGKLGQKSPETPVSGTETPVSGTSCDRNPPYSILSDSIPSDSKGNSPQTPQGASALNAPTGPGADPDPDYVPRAATPRPPARFGGDKDYTEHIAAAKAARDRTLAASRAASEALRNKPKPEVES
jgi:hypothetical protein